MTPEINLITPAERAAREQIRNAQEEQIAATAQELAANSEEEPFVEGQYRGHLKLCCKHCPFDRVIRKGETRDVLEAEMWKHHATMHVNYVPRRFTEITTDLVTPQGDNLKGTVVATD